jgi:hypothetical protein
MLHADNRYDRMTDDVAKVTGEPAMSVGAFVTKNLNLFQGGAQ